jgi:hypothetical protein
MVLSDRKVEHQVLTGLGQPSCCIVWSGLLVETLLKAPRTSKKGAEVMTCVDFHISTSWASARVASIADVWGWPPI